MSYKGASKEFLDSADITIGDSVKITKNDIYYEGIILDRAEDADDFHVVLKLTNGYNIGLNITDSKIELLKKGEKPKIELKSFDIEKNPKMQDISIISTGGTVASIIDYKTGAVHPAFTADDLLKANPELLEHANIKGKAIYNILSENMKPEYWVKAANSVAEEINDGAHGVVVSHGTDTMHYTSAALSFILDSPVPIVVTGAQRSSDRPSSDAYLNLINSVTAAKSDLAEVMVCMHGTENDNFGLLHRGTKVRKMHTSRRDTFRSINISPIAKVQNGNIEILDKDLKYKLRSDTQVEIKDSIEPNVAFIKSYPGISGELIDYHIDKGYKGIILEGTGLGHCPEEVISPIGRAKEENIPVIMTSQCLYGEVNMHVYSTGRKLISAGVISAGDMLPETAFVKLIWTLGQTDKINEVEKIMQTNIAGEIEDKISLKYFLV
ncbi:MAG: Glu-tRNA(Gln) amidotransferase subunit GatD [Methanobacterium sp.]